MYAEHFQHRQTPLHSLFVKVYQQASDMGTFTTRRTNYGVPWWCCTPEFEEAVLHAVKEDMTMSTRNIAGRTRMWITKLSGMFCLSNSYTHTTPRRYRQCSHRILHHEPTSTSGSCTDVWKSSTSHGRSFSLMKPSSPGKLFSIHARVMCRLMKTHMLRHPMGFRNDTI